MPRDALIVAILILASSASFGFGYLAGLEGLPQPGQGSDAIVESNPPSSASWRTTAGEAGQFVASKNGTKYYLPSCAGATKISAANKIWFASASAARAAGYAPAANCSGI